MKNYCLILLLSLSACAQVPSYYKEVKTDPVFHQEKELLGKKLNGKLPCYDTNLTSFLFSNKIPIKQCLYFNNGGVKDGEIISSLVQVLQTLPTGFLLEISYQSCNKYGCVTEKAPNLIFLHRTDEQKELIDGKYLSSFYPWDLYEYVGPYTYRSILVAPKTVYSFKRISREVITHHQKNFSKYNMWLEFYAEVGAFKYQKETEEALRSKKNNINN